MEKRTKALHPVNATSASEVMGDLAKALSGSGPALAFCQTQSAVVTDPISIVVATSGSSGPAKEVALSAKALISSARASNKFLAAQYGDTWSLLLPLTHIAGINVLLRSLELGTTAIDLRNLRSYPKADFSAIVPTQLFRALNGDNEMLSHLQSCKAVLVGGAALSAELRSQACAVDINLVSTYGMTETCGGCVYGAKPLEGVEVEIRNNRIAIKGSVLASTYLNNQKEWEENFVDGWFLTQDIGSLNSGELLVENRLDDVIITGGEKLSLLAVAEVLRSNFLSHAFAAFGVNDAEWGTAFYLAVVGDPGLSDFEICRHLADALGYIAKPKKILRLSKLPLTAIGKIDRAALIEFATMERGAQ